MEIKPSERRREISDLFVKDDFKGIGRLGLKMNESSSADCAHYILLNLGIVPSGRVFDALRSLPKADIPHSGLNVVIYNNGSDNTHYGFYDGKKVTSKWGVGPVFEHSLEDVPIQYGKFVKFTSYADALVLLSSADGS